MLKDKGGRIQLITDNCESIAQLTCCM